MRKHQFRPEGEPEKLSVKNMTFFLRHYKQQVKSRVSRSDIDSQYEGEGAFCQFIPFRRSRLFLIDVLFSSGPSEAGGLY